ncbi:MAG: hypothetical protein JNM56_38420 [Planctomycetia bacterium]|nr:hypothetical protein [Planctomycetia bacterium]
MHPGPISPSRRRISSETIAFRLVVLLLPAVLLVIGSFRTEGDLQRSFWLGALLQILVFSFLLITQRAWHQPLGTAATFLYLMGIGWLWLSRSISDDWFSHVSRFLLLIVPLSIFALQTLVDSGAVASRRANLLAQRISTRKDWPADLADVKSMAEVKAFRDAVAIDASPALRLLEHPRAQVRLAALTALEFRQDWKRGQPEVVIEFAKEAPEPLLRAAAMAALANLEDRLLVEQTAEFLTDPAKDVRRAAADALLWNCEERWPWIRQAVRTALADPAQANDGPLLTEGPELSPDAIADMLGWAAEKGPAAVRAALTLGAYYQRVLTTQADDPILIKALKQQLMDMQAPPALRIELAQVLKVIGELDCTLEERLLDPANPGSLRLLAAEGLLTANNKHPQALVVLHDIARMPNREMALATADVVQRRLGVDLGLALGQPLPPLHSRQAADVMRRLMKWAAVADATPTGNEADGSGSDTKLDKDQPGSAQRRSHGSGTFGLPSGLR